MHEGHIHIACAFPLDEFDRLRDGTACIHFVIHDDHVAVFGLADQGQGFGFGIVA